MKYGEAIVYVSDGMPIVAGTHPKMGFDGPVLEQKAAEFMDHDPEVIAREIRIADLQHELGEDTVAACLKVS